MTIRVTSQAELDAALANPATRHLTIDSPEGVWLTLDTDRTDVITDITGNSRLKKATGSARLGWMGGSARLDVMGGSARLGWMGGSARLGWMGGSARLGRMDGFARLGRMDGSARLGRMDGSARLGRMGGSARLDVMGGSARLGRMGGSARLGRMGGSARLGWMGGSARLDVMTGSARLDVMTGSARLRAAAGTPTIHLYGGTVEHAAPHVAVYLHSASATVSGGHLIDLTGLDLTDVEQWRAHVGADHATHPDNPRLIIPSVSSQDHAGELDRDGRIRIGCWAGTPDELRTLINGDRWPSHADKEDREQYRPRILAFADLADQQIAAWAAAPKAEAGTDA